jgi:hypothetical protein
VRRSFGGLARRDAFERQIIIGDRQAISSDAYIAARINVRRAPVLYSANDPNFDFTRIGSTVAADPPKTSCKAKRDYADMSVYGGIRLKAISRRSNSLKPKLPGKKKPSRAVLLTRTSSGQSSPCADCPQALDWPNNSSNQLSLRHNHARSSPSRRLN